MTDYLAFLIVKLLSFIFCLLPVRLSLFAGKCLGTVIWVFNRKRRVIAYANLKAAFCKEKAPSEIRVIVRRVYQNLGMITIETLRLPAVNKRYIEKFISVKGIEKIEGARSKHEGAIALTGHFGNWEMLSIAGGAFGFPLSVLAREQKHTRLNDLLNSYRELTGSRVIQKGLATRQLVKALKSGELVGILADQDAGKLGTFVNFFGRPTSTHDGAFVFAAKTGAKVLPTFIIRERGPRHRVEILDPIHLKVGEQDTEEIKKAIQEFSTILEGYVRRFPQQWLWVHKRWKSTPQRRVLILSDSRPGHLNQSLAVAKIIQRYREDRGYASEYTKVEVIEARYKNKFSRRLLTLCSNFASSRCQGCMACVKVCLEKESFDKLIHTYADIIISCGSSLAPINVFLSKELNARNIVIMKPSLVGLKKFKLAIVPRHDKPKLRRNVLVTTGSPNTINEEQMKAAAEKFSGIVKTDKPLRLGLLLGGDNPDYKMEIDYIKNIIAQIKSVSAKLDLAVLATTSRRTPAGVDTLLKNELGSFENCGLLVIANEKNIAGTVPAILGLSSVAIVSGESISMISEAVGSGRHVLVFKLGKKNAGKQLRHEKMVEEMARAGFIKLVDPDSISRAIEESIGVKGPAKKLNDYENIYKAVGSIL